MIEEAKYRNLENISSCIILLDYISLQTMIFSNIEEKLESLEILITKEEKILYSDLRKNMVASLQVF